MSIMSIPYGQHLVGCVQIPPPTLIVARRVTTPLLPMLSLRSFTGCAPRHVPRAAAAHHPPHHPHLDHHHLHLDGMDIGRPTLLHAAWWRFGHWLHAHYFQQHTLGAEHLPLDDGMFVLASNHASHLDCSSVYTAAQQAGCSRTYALGARDYFFKSPFVRWFVTTLMNVIPFNRRGFTQRDVDNLLLVQALASAQQPTAVLMFPEGTRSTNAIIGPFKSGVSFIADKLHIKVVPTYVHGTRDALPKHTYVPLPHQITVVFGPPLHFQRPKDPTQLKAALQDFADQIRQQVVKLQAQVLAEQQGGGAMGRGMVPEGAHGKQDAMGGPRTSTRKRSGGGMWTAVWHAVDWCMVLLLHGIAVVARMVSGMLMGNHKAKVL